MMAPDYCLGVDIGTQGAKAVVYDVATRAVVGRGSSPYGLLTDPARPGLAEQDPQTWVDGATAAIRAALKGLDGERVSSVGVSGQQHGLVALDAERRPLRPAKLWCDVESHAEAEELSRARGFTMNAAFTATKVPLLKRHEPATFAKLRHILMPKDFFNLWLTGELATEASDASGSGYFDLATSTWDVKALAEIDARLPQCVPRLVGPAECVGRVRDEAARLLGLAGGGAVKVSPGGGDNAMSALAAGAVKDGVMVMSLGTSGTLFGCSSTPVLDKSGQSPPPPPPSPPPPCPFGLQTDW